MLLCVFAGVGVDVAVAFRVAVAVLVGLDVFVALRRVLTAWDGCVVDDGELPGSEEVAVCAPLQLTRSINTIPKRRKLREPLAIEPFPWHLLQDIN